MSGNTIDLIINEHPSGDGTLTIHVDDGEYGTSGTYSIAASIGVITLYQMADKNAISLPDGVKFDDIIYEDLNQLAIAVRQRVRDLGGDVYWQGDDPILALMEPIKHPKDLDPVPEQPEPETKLSGIDTIHLELSAHQGKLRVDADYVNSATDQRYELLCNALLQVGIKAAISEDDGSAYPMADYHLLYARPEGKEKVEIFAEHPFGDTNCIPTIAQAIEVAKSHHDVSSASCPGHL